jgi:hypothetical protein
MVLVLTGAQQGTPGLASLLCHAVDTRTPHSGTLWSPVGGRDGSPDAPALPPLPLQGRRSWAPARSWLPCWSGTAPAWGPPCAGARLRCWPATGRAA